VHPAGREENDLPEMHDTALSDVGRILDREERKLAKGTGMEAKIKMLRENEPRVGAQKRVPVEVRE
jgi:hypothetical protein